MADQRFFDCHGGIPSVCYEQVLSNLPMSDCLSFAAASTTTLSETIDVLVERRDRLKRPVVVVKRVLDRCVDTTREAQEEVQQQQQQLSTPADEGRAARVDEEHVTLLPSLQDRVGLLAGLLPVNCDVYQSVQQLRVCLSEDAIAIQREARQSSLKSFTAMDMIPLLKRITLPLKLCSKILKGALTCRSEVGCFSRGLHHYIGDVLCVAFLFDNHELSREVNLRAAREYPSTYQYWVVTHASLIRRWEFSEEQRKALRIMNFKDLTSAEHRRLTWFPEFIVDDERHKDSILTLIYDDFAPLGPQFRGRDIVQIRDVTAKSMKSGSPAALTWIQLAHDQAFKTRPMTVRPPEIRF